MLCQTVFTLRYVHHLHGNISHPAFKITPDADSWATPTVPLDANTEDGMKRPPELVSLVLRAGMYGLVKSVDFAWREMYKQSLYEVSR